MPSESAGLLAQRCRAYSLRMTAGQAFGHVTAAQLYGLPLPLYARDARLHVAVVAGFRPSQDKGVAGHEIDDRLWEVQRVLVRNDPEDGLFELTVVTPALLLAQLASVLDLDDLVAVGDAMVASEGPLVTVEEISEIAARSAGRRGAKRLRLASTLIRVGSRSRTESIHRLQLVRAGLPEPDLNVEVSDAAGNLISTADEVWPAFRTLVEYEGDWHRTSRGKFRSDITRFERYADADWSGLRAQADDVFIDPNPFIGFLWRRLEARGWAPQLREPLRVASARR